MRLHSYNTDPTKNDDSELSDEDVDISDDCIVESDNV